MTMLPSTTPAHVSASVATMALPAGSDTMAPETPAATAPSASIVPTAVSPASAELDCPALIGGSLAGKMTLPITPASTLRPMSQPPAAPIATLPEMTHIQDMAKESGPPNDESGVKHVYQDYKEDEFKQQLEQLVDCSRWLEDCKRVRKMIVSK